MSTTPSMYCVRHPKVETGLTCATCGTPICPKCMVVTPVGMKCPGCVKGKGSALFQVRPERFLLAGITALAAGAMTVLVSGFGFLVILISIPYGYFAGSMILRASGMKRGIKLEVLAGAGMVAGGLAAKLAPILPFAHLSPRLFLSVLNPIFLLALGIATACAVSKIRYM